MIVWRTAENSSKAQDKASTRTHVRCDTVPPVTCAFCRSPEPAGVIQPTPVSRRACLKAGR